MKAVMSFDGIQRVDVPIVDAIDKAFKKLDDYNLTMLNGIKTSVFKFGKITKADYDYVIEYLRGDYEKRIS